MNALETLAKETIIVADTGDLDSIEKWQPQDATTNPSLVLKCISSPQGKALLEEYLQSLSSEHRADSNQVYAGFLGILAKKILEIVPGLVSIEVNPHYSYSTEKTIENVLELKSQFEAVGIDTRRILFKIAATWEGLEASLELEKLGLKTNMTLVFSLEQAELAAINNSFLISPFVGRVYDWYKQQSGKEITYDQDPGVALVAESFKRIRAAGAKTIVMGASFRTPEQVLALAGCDRLTISPSLLEKLAKMPEKHEIQSAIQQQDISSNYSLRELDARSFATSLEANPMASQKLQEGIELFIEDFDRVMDFFNC